MRPTLSNAGIMGMVGTGLLGLQHVALEGLVHAGHSVASATSFELASAAGAAAALNITTHAMFAPLIPYRNRRDAGAALTLVHANTALYGALFFSDHPSPAISLVGGLTLGASLYVFSGLFLRGIAALQKWISRPEQGAGVMTAPRSAFVPLTTLQMQDERISSLLQKTEEVFLHDRSMLIAIGYDPDHFNLQDELEGIQFLNIADVDGFQKLSASAAYDASEDVIMCNLQKVSLNTFAHEIVHALHFRAMKKRLRGKHIRAFVEWWQHKDISTWLPEDRDLLHILSNRRITAGRLNDDVRRAAAHLMWTKAPRYPIEAPAYYINRTLLPSEQRSAPFYRVLLAYLAPLAKVGGYYFSNPLFEEIRAMSATDPLQDLQRRGPLVPLLPPR